VRVVVQRVRRSEVTVEAEPVAAIGLGLLCLVGVEAGDGAADISYVASKIRELRIFPDEAGRMNRSVVEVGGSVIVVSQFTLLGDVRKGRRPAFDRAADPETARHTYEDLVAALRAPGLQVETGRFQAHMVVALENDGPVTILIDSRKTF
jgi:D-tyrosyl-tRNA(Tyr) deacylase